MKQLGSVITTHPIDGGAAAQVVVTELWECGVCFGAVTNPSEHMARHEEEYSKGMGI